MYTLIGSPRSRTFRVLWALTELEQDYEYLPYPPRSDGAKQVNPSGKVPTLLVDGTPIYDSVAILTYLADTHGCLTFPAGTIDRAKQDSLTQFIIDEFDSRLWTAARHSFILPEEKRLPEIKDSLRWEMANSFNVLDARMGDGPFLCGEVMTIADILLTHCLNWAEGAKFQITSDKALAYRDRVVTRPNYIKARAIGT